MQQRLDYFKASPAVMKAMLALEQAIRAIEQGDYRPGVIAIERELKVRRG